MFEIRNLIRMNRAILIRSEKKHFLLLTLIFLFTSLFDIVGIGAIGSFLMIMMNPSVLYHLPIVGRIIPEDWPVNRTLFLLGVLILVVFLIKTITGCLVQKRLISYCYMVGARIRTELMERYLYVPYSYFVSHHTSDAINKILTYANNYSGGILVSFMLLIVHSIFVLAIVVFLFFFHPYLTVLLIILFFGMVSAHLFLVKNKLYAAGLKANINNQQMIKNVQEGLLGLKEVRILSKENFFINRIRIESEGYAQSYGFITVFQRLPFYFLESIMFIFIISLCLIELGVGAQAQEIIALCGILVTAGIRLLPSLYQIAVAIVTAQSSQHGLEVIYKNLFDFKADFNNEPAWPKRVEAAVLDHQAARSFSEIKFDNVGYCYPNAQQCAVDSISLTIKRGQAIGIIGPSGAGKSTLVDLLLGLLVPTKGTILMDGNPLITPNAWVDKFAYIPQIIYLMDASIKQNIVFGEMDSLIDNARLMQSIEMAQLTELITQLPNGIETLIGENGVRLSGGQRQRIALARAFYHEREIIVMDEATSALDNETEREVVEAIKRLHNLKTLVIIAHRYTTVKYCDIIYRLQDGKIMQSGSFDEVIDGK